MWLLLAMEMIASLQAPVTLDGGRPVTVILVDEGEEAQRERLQAARDDPARQVVLRIGAIRSEGAAAASFEVAVAAGPCAQGGAVVGAFSLYEPSPGVGYAFTIDHVLGGGKLTPLKAVFTPVSGIEQDGRPVPAEPAGRVTIGEISLVAEKAAGAAPR